MFLLTSSAGVSLLCPPPPPLFSQAKQQASAHRASAPSAQITAKQSTAPRSNPASAAAPATASSASTSASSSSKPKTKTPVDVSVGAALAEGRASNEVFRILCPGDRERIGQKRNVDCLLPTLPRRKIRQSATIGASSTDCGNLKNDLDERCKTLKHQNELLHNRASFVRHQMALLHEMYETGLDIISRANDMRRVPDNCLPSRDEQS